MSRIASTISRVLLFAAGLLLILLVSVGLIFGSHVVDAQSSAVSFSSIQGGSFDNAMVCHGTVQVVNSPNVGTLDNEFDAVASSRSQDSSLPPGNRSVWAVGRYLNPSGIPQTLIERWSGNAWSVVESPNVGSNRNYLNAVAVVGPNDVWAAGFYWYMDNVQRTLTEHWNGTEWSIVPSPNGSTYENYLNGLAVVGPHDVWAVGLYSPDAYGYHTLAMHWDGNQWSIVTTPNMNTRDNYLNSVSIGNGNDIWAVGYYSETRADQKTLTMHWDGTAWTIVSSPNVGTNRNYFNGVAVVSSNDAWAVGFYWDANNVQRTLTEHWNGTAWNIVQSPNVGSHENYLNSVTVVGHNDVWAVGLYSPDTVEYVTLVLHWDGGGWHVLSSPDPGSKDNYLYGVVALGHNDVWAVGYSRDTGAQEKTLTERYSCRH
jgi:hypothetical protein